MEPARSIPGWHIEEPVFEGFAARTDYPGGPSGCICRFLLRSCCLPQMAGGSASVFAGQSEEALDQIGVAMRRAGLFAAANLPFMLQNVGGQITRSMTTHMQAAFKTASFHFVNTSESKKWDIVGERLEPVNGFLRVPEQPGLGVTLDREELERGKRLEIMRAP